MKIALLSLHFAEYSAGFARALAQEHDVLFIAERTNVRLELGEDWERSAKPFAVELVDWRRSARSAVECVRSVVAALGAFDPDVVHEQETLLDLHAALVPVLSRRPLVLTVHDPVPHSGEKQESFLGRRRHLYQRAHRRSADRIVVHSEILRAELAAQAPGASPRLRVLPHGVLGREPGDGPVAPSRPGRALFLGRMQPYKGLSVFVDAVRSLYEDGVAVTGVIAGKGPSLDEIRPAIEGHSAFEVHAEFLPRNRMIGFVDESSLVALPYTDGTQSGVAALALGRGRPIVASRVGGLPEMARPEVSGLLVSPGRADELASAMRRILVDDVLRSTLAAGARSLGDGPYSWEHVARHAVGVYREVVGS